uniref:Cytokine receptor-like factor 2 n=1 Tax=Chinchilla lanigera TaxID=34839 RepID=A0A8C2YHZ7_CHILA
MREVQACLECLPAQASGFGEDQALVPCTNYIVQHGRTAGCLLQGRDDVLNLTIRDGPRPVLSMRRWVAEYLKPSSPRDLQFLWGQEAVTVLCSPLPHPGLLYEVQHTTPHDTQWQSQVSEVCNITIRGVDVEQCHLFRARVKTKDSYYGPKASPSDWSQVTHWRGATTEDSCVQPLVGLWPRWTRFFLVCSLVSLLTVALLLVALWKAQRVKRLLMPSVPDPRGSFSGLFEHHQGNLQEWIADTQDVAPWRKPPGGEQEQPSEQTLEVQLSRVDTELPAAPPTREEEAPAGSPRLPPRDPQAGNLVSLGGFTFVMTDSAYMKL